MAFVLYYVLTIGGFYTPTPIRNTKKNKIGVGKFNTYYMIYIEHNNPNDEVQVFCKENNIEYSWDWNKEHGSWNEIFIDGKLLMQISQGITKNQFLNVIKILKNDYYSKDFPYDEIDFDICLISDIEHEELFNQFLKKHENIFKNT